jgi:phosphatidylglycerol---prolipoprotein diacylglyceryl transferase
MFVNNIDPVLATIGPLQIRYYGLVYAIGFLAAYLILRNISKKGKIKNLDEEKTDELMIWLILGLIIGARLFSFVFYNTSALLNNPLEFFYIWNGGMSFHGALVGSFAAIYYYCKKHKLEFYTIVDILVIPAALFLFFGRIANYINSELVGTITTSEKTPWCVVYQKVDSYCRHPSQLYEAAKNLLIFFALIAMHKSKIFKKGVLFWSFVLMYGALRFIENFWRDDVRYLGLSTGQYLSLIMVPIAIYFLIKINTKKE